MNIYNLLAGAVMTAGLSFVPLDGVVKAADCQDQKDEAEKRVDRDLERKSIAKMVELQARAEQLEKDLLELRAERAAVKKDLRAARPDLACDCDEDYCTTRRRDQEIRRNELDRYCHDDQDFGSIGIVCKSGVIMVEIYETIWSQKTKIAFKELAADSTGLEKSWTHRFSGFSSIFDSTFTIEITVPTLVDSNGKDVTPDKSSYDLDFHSEDR